MKSFAFLCCTMLIASMGCRSTQQTSANQVEKAPERELRMPTPTNSTPAAIVYKTTKDFSNYVPVILDAQHKHIVSYPAPTDVYYKGQLAKPTALENGYWLDNRGINEHVAFLSYTYEEYSQLGAAPDMQLLESKIMERYPLIEMYDCGKRNHFTDEISELNSLIKDGFPGCHKLHIPKPMNVTLNKE